MVFVGSHGSRPPRISLSVEAEVRDLQGVAAFLRAGRARVQPWRRG